MNQNITLASGPTDVERWTKTIMEGVKRWPKVEHARRGLGDSFAYKNKVFAEMNYTMREIKFRTKLGKTHQQRAIQLRAANPPRDPHEFKQGWIELIVDSDSRLQEAITLARQAYMEAQR